MSGGGRPMGSGELGPGLGSAARLPDLLRRALALAREELAARFGRGEWALLALVVAIPIAFMWHFSSPSYFFWDDLAHLYWAHNSGALLSYAFEPSWGHFTPAYSVAYLALDRIAPMNFQVALGALLVCHAISAVLLQRILTLLFGRNWWTYAVALAWAISFIYLPAFTWFAAGLHSITTTTATLASIHGYLSWRASGRRLWLVWSVVAMCVGLGFYEKAVLIPFYLILIRILLLDPDVRLRDSVRSLLDEWGVWLVYGMVCVSVLLIYLLGDYAPPAGGITIGELVRYLGVFWAVGLWPAVFGIRVPEGALENWQVAVVVTTQMTLTGLAVWSIARRRTAWRAWTFLLLAVIANALIVIGRVSQFGGEFVAHYIYYYPESGLLMALAIAFAFAPVGSRASSLGVEPAKSGASSRAKAGRLRPPNPAVIIVTCGALALYVGVSWATADTISNGQGSSPEETAAQAGRFSRAYFDNLRGDLASASRRDTQPSLLDYDVPEAVVSPLANLDPSAAQAGVRYTLLSSVVPLIADHVTFEGPRHLYKVKSDGHLERTRFVPTAGGSPAELRRTGHLEMIEAHGQHRGGEWCVVAEDLSALEWQPRSHLAGRNWGLRVRYRTDPVESFGVQTNSLGGWTDNGAPLPPMASSGTATVPLTGLTETDPANAAVRLLVPPFGRLCLRSFEIGSFHSPPALPSP